MILRHRRERSRLRGVLGDLGRREAGVPDADSGSVLPQAHEAFPGAVGERLEKNRVHDGKDRDVGSDAERERGRRGDRVARILAQAAKGRTRILDEILEPPGAAGFPAFLLMSRGCSKCAKGFRSRLLRREAPVDVLLDLHLDVEAHLLIEVPVELVPVEEGPPGGRELGFHGAA